MRRGSTRPPSAPAVTTDGKILMPCAPSTPLTASIAAATCSGEPTASGCPAMAAEPIENDASAAAPFGCSAFHKSPESTTAGPLAPPRRSSLTAAWDRDPSSSMPAVLEPASTAAASPTVKSPSRVTASERRGSAWALSCPPRTNSPAGAACDRSTSPVPLESARLGSGRTGGAPARVRKRPAAPADIVADSPRAASPERSTVERAKPTSRLRPPTMGPAAATRAEAEPTSSVRVGDLDATGSGRSAA